MRQSQKKKNKAPNDFKRQIVELLKGLETGDREPLAGINPNKHIQHNLRLADGLAGFRERLEALPKGLPRIPCAFFRMAALSLPMRNTTSTVRRQALILSDLK